MPSSHSKLIPIEDKPGEYKLVGQYADMWQNIQVKPSYISLHMHTLN